MGKPIAQSVSESYDAANVLRSAVERAKHLYGEVLTQSVEGMANDLAFTKREPLGVVACIIPNNFPIELTMQKIAPALTMGNTVLAKAPSSNPMAIDPAFTLIQCALLLVSSIAWGIAFSRPSLWTILRLMSWSLFVDFLFVGAVVATCTWFAVYFLTKMSTIEGS